MDEELFNLRHQVYATAATYHGAGATWMAAHRAEGSSEAERQLLDAFLAAGAQYNAALDALHQYLTTALGAGERIDERVRIQRFRELLHEELEGLLPYEDARGE